MKKIPKTNGTDKLSNATNVIRGYVRKRGFYIALFALVAILVTSVFVTGYVRKSGNVGSSFNDDAWKAAIAESEKRNLEKDKETQDVNSGTLPISVQTPTATATATPESQTEQAAVTTNNNTIDAVQEYDEDDIEVTAVLVNSSEEKIEMDMPSIGGIIKEYSMDELVYSKTMDDWRTHSGIDIAAGEGAQVKAAADGIVSDVYTDEMLGNVVVIDHGAGIKSVYGNLQSSDYIEVKRAVSKGDIIGGIGRSGGEEKEDEPHIHFEVWKDDEPINPNEFL